MMQQIAAAAGLHYASNAELDALLDECRGRVLGIVQFGKASPGRKDLVSAWVDMPVIGADQVYEVWTSASPVQVETSGRIQSARNAQILFGCVEIPENSELAYDALIYDHYCAILDHLDERGYPNLLRIWHYLPDIHRDEQALERYKRFSLGRHEAFVAKARAIITDAPAASAV